MKINQIEAFKTVMECGSVTAAAERMLLSQPAVSKLIAQFEWAIDMPMFVREKGRLTPTPEARMLYEQVAQTFALISDIGSVARQIKNLKHGHLVIGAMPMLCHSWLPTHCVEYSTDTEISCDIRSRSSMTILEWVASGQVDIGFGMIADHPNVDAELLAEIEAVCLLSPEHDLLPKQTITHTDFNKQRFVHTGGLDGTRDKIEAMFTTFDIDVDSRFETNSASTTCNLIAAGGGMALVNALSAWEFRHLGYETRRFEPKLHFRIYLLRPKHRPVSRLAQAFGAHVRERISELGRIPDILFNPTQ